MASVNKVLLLGNLGKDPETRVTAQGMAVCKFSMATSTKRKVNNELVEETQWHRVTVFDKLAETAGKYLQKGSSIFLEGSIKYGQFTNKDGVEQYTTDIIGDRLTMVGPKPASDRAPAPAPTPPRAPAKAASGGFDDMDDDIPW